MEKAKEMLKKKKWLPGAIVAAAVIAIGVAVGAGKAPVSGLEATVTPVAAVTELTANVPTQEPAAAETVATQTDAAATQKSQREVASNMYVEYDQPTENADAYIHEQEIDGNAVSDKYYVTVAGEKKLLYSIDFGREDGTWLGMLVRDAGNISITYNVYPLSEEEMAAMSEAESQHYYDVMDGLGTMLASICEKEGFQEEKIPEGTGKRIAQLTYWTLELPNDMTWTESNENGEYQAIFYGTVQDQQVALYTVRIGHVQAQSVLGKYRVNGEEKTLSVESYGLSQHETWTDEDFLEAGEMMETINDLIQVIDASADFTAE